jgi:hypothetical protein
MSSSEEHQKEMGSVRELLTSARGEKDGLLPSTVVRTVMGFRERPELIALAAEREALMSEMIDAEGVHFFARRFLDSNVSDGHPGGSRTSTVLTIAMAGGGAQWHDYQVHHEEGRGFVKLCREGSGGLHRMQGSVLVIGSLCGYFETRRCAL